MRLELFLNTPRFQLPNIHNLSGLNVRIAIDAEYQGTEKKRKKEMTQPS